MVNCSAIYYSTVLKELIYHQDNMQSEDKL